MRFPWQNIVPGIRITGVSTAAGGIQWEYRATDVDRAGQLILDLEDRRVFRPPPRPLADLDACAASVQEIRKNLTTLLQQLDPSSTLELPFKALRAACRKFLDQTDGLQVADSVWASHHELEKAIFFTALGELRASFGFQIAQLAVVYHIDLDEELVSILPPADDD
jgi:hypothetical protein